VGCRREAARVFGLNRETVAKMCRFSLPPGYTRTKPVEKPKLGPLLPVIDSVNAGAKMHRPAGVKMHQGVRSELPCWKALRRQLPSTNTKRRTAA
jgi:hypothetical protein